MGVHSEGATDEATFVVIGAGGLGCPAILGLLALGARRLWLVDDDRVDVTNLQRQILYAVGDVGMSKIDAARMQIQRRAPETEVQTMGVRLEPCEVETFLTTLPPSAVVLECTDDPELKFALNDAALVCGVPLVIGAALGFRGQAIAVERGFACYRCIYEAAPREPATCEAAGVLGSTVGVIGFHMARLAMAFAARVRPVEISGQLMAIDLRTMAVQSLRPAPRPGCGGCERARFPARFHDCIDPAHARRCDRMF